MKLKSILTIITFLAPLLSACGAKAVPTIDPAQVQASAVAAANTIVAMTQAAMPTETPIPPTDTPTDTPQPTPTIPPLPTSLVFASPTVAASSSNPSGDPCGGPISKSKGQIPATILVNNRTNVLLGVSFYLNKNKFGDCGFYSSQISSNGSLMVTNLPANSCYHVTAWTLSGKPNFMKATDFCVGMLSDKFTLNVTTTVISIVAP